jgi:hypothetical protein
MNTQRKTFINQIKAKDVRKLSQPIEGTYDPMQHRINAKNTIDNVWVGIAIVGMLICLWQVW